MDSSQIVSCSGLDCSVCGIMEVVSNLFRYLMGIAGIVAVLLLILAGFMFIFNLGKEKELNKAKAVAKYAIFGFIVTLVSFLVIYSLYKITGASDKGNWFQIDCTVESLEQKSNLQKQQEVEQKFEFINAGSVFPTAEDPRKITNLDVASLNPQNLLFDSLELLPGQMIRFIVSDKNLNESEINDYVSSEKGFFVLPGADRAIGTGTDEIIKIIRDGDIIRIV